MKLREMTILMIAGAMIIASTLVPSAAAGLPLKQIGVVYDGPWERLPDVIDVLKKEITGMAGDEYDVRFPEEKLLSGEWNIVQVNKALDSLLADPEIDLVLALGYVTTHEACQRSDLPKPVIATDVIDAQAQQLPLKDGTSGVANLNYINIFRDLERSMDIFRQLASFKRTVLMADGFVLAWVPQLKEDIARIGREYGMDITVVEVGTSAEEALAGIPTGSEAVFLAMVPRLSATEFKILVDGLIQRKLPSFTFGGRDDVKVGVLASTLPEGVIQQTARSVAVNVNEIFSGEQAADLPVTFSLGEKPTINMATARAIGVYPSLSLRTEAELLNDERVDIQRRLTLETAVREALAANLDLRVAQQVVAAGEQAVLEARSPLLPQIGLSTQVVAIDGDRAAASQGNNPEKTWSGSAVGSQQIYSDRDWAAYDVEKHQQTTRVESYQTLKLDIVQQAATAYLDVLRARAIERIQKENLRLTRANLERARIRQSIGVAGPDEVYRWESAIADSRQAVIASESVTLDIMQALNRLLNRPVQELFIAEETELTDPLLAFSNQLFYKLVSNPRYLELFRDFAAKEGKNVAPELKQLDAQISAQERILLAAKREFYIPNFSLDADASELFSESGKGQRSDSPLLDLDETDWRVGIFARYPLYAGGRKSATRRRAVEDLKRLKYRRNATAERIDRRVQNAINKTRSSYPSIQLTRDAAEAARKNLELVIDSYAQGIKSIIDLIDAQNLSVTNDQRSANAVYNFLIDLMDVQRSVGSYDILFSASDQKVWREKLETAFKQAGAEIDF